MFQFILELEMYWILFITVKIIRIDETFVSFMFLLLSIDTYNKVYKS